MVKETGSRNGEAMNEFFEVFGKIPNLKLFVKVHNDRWLVDVTYPSKDEKHGDMEAAHGMDFDRDKAFRMALDALNNFIKSEVFK